MWQKVHDNALGMALATFMFVTVFWWFFVVGFVWLVHGLGS